MGTVCSMANMMTPDSSPPPSPGIQWIHEDSGDKLRHVVHEGEVTPPPYVPVDYIVNAPQVNVTGGIFYGIPTDTSLFAIDKKVRYRDNRGIRKKRSNNQVTPEKPWTRGDTEKRRKAQEFEQRLRQGD